MKPVRCKEMAFRREGKHVRRHEGRVSGTGVGRDKWLGVAGICMNAGQQQETG